MVGACTANRYARDPAVAYAADVGAVELNPALGDLRLIARAAVNPLQSGWDGSPGLRQGLHHRVLGAGNDGTACKHVVRPHHKMIGVIEGVRINCPHCEA
jgi:hypothetical protein